jgi:MFS transporter, OFA family, oxalate/formate antiporter
MVLVAGVLSQMVIGSIYAWAEIGSRLSLVYKLEDWQTQLIYGLTIGVFSFGTIITGPLVRKWGPNKLTFLSGIFYILSFTGAWLSKGSFPILVLTLGLGVGIAIALSYVVPLSTATAWFPEKKGSVTGLAVMGFGGGAIFSSWVIRGLSTYNLDILFITLILGVAGGIILITSSFFQKFPKDCPNTPKPEVISRKDLFNKSKFWILCGIMFLATTGGLIVIGSVVTLSREWGVGNVSAVAITVIALGNASGRLLWGGIIDKLKLKAIPLSLGLMATGFIILLFSASSPVLFILGLLITGMQFGSSLVIYSVYTEMLFGHGAIGKVYPFIFASYGLGAIIGPTIGGLLHDIYKSYTPILMIIILFPLLSMLLFGILVKKN